MGSVREDVSDLRSSTGRYLPRSGYLRNSVPTSYWPYQLSATDGVPGSGGHSGGDRSRTPRSWQARNQWYSRAAIGFSIGAIVVVLLIGIFA